MTTYKKIIVPTLENRFLDKCNDFSDLLFIIDIFFATNHGGRPNRGGNQQLTQPQMEEPACPATPQPGGATAFPAQNLTRRIGGPAQTVIGASIIALRDRIEREF